LILQGIQLTAKLLDLQTRRFPQFLTFTARRRQAGILEPVGKPQDGLFQGRIGRLKLFLKRDRVGSFGAVGNAEADFFKLILLYEC
jgi:hypothetical protein